MYPREGSSSTYFGGGGGFFLPCLRGFRKVEVEMVAGQCIRHLRCSVPRLRYGLTGVVRLKYPHFPLIGLLFCLHQGELFRRNKACDSATSKSKTIFCFSFFGGIFKRFLV